MRHITKHRKTAISRSGLLALGAVALMATLLAGCNGSSTSRGSDTSKVGEVVLVSSAADGIPANRPSAVGSWSPDGAKVAFYSSASNLAPNGTGHHVELYTKNLRTGAVALISSSSTGREGNGDSEGAWWSPDGTRVMFASTASNLAASRNECEGEHLFIKNLQTGRISQVAGSLPRVVPVSVSPDGPWSPDGSRVAFIGGSCYIPEQQNGDELYVQNLSTGSVTPIQGYLKSGYGGYWGPLWSPNGAKLMFASASSNPDSFSACEENLPQCETEVFVEDVRSGLLTTACATAPGGIGDCATYHPPAWSPDGTRVIFEASDDSARGWSVFIRDLRTSEVTQVSPQLPEGNDYEVDYYGGSWSPDGTRVAFFKDPIQSGAVGPFDTFVRVLRTPTIRRVSITEGGRRANGASWGALWSPDGSRMVFVSKASNLVPGDTNRNLDVFVKDLRSGAITLVSGSAAGRIGNGKSEGALWSPDGRRILFTSTASNLTARNTRGAAQVFVKVIAK